MAVRAATGRLLPQSDGDTLSALQHRPATIEPAFGQITFPDADIEAALTNPRPDLGVSLDLQHVLPAVGAREVRRALPSLEGAVGLARFLVIRPINWSAILLNALMKGFDRRVVPVVVISELDAIRLKRILPRERNPTDLVDRTVSTEHIRVLLSEILPKLLVSFLFLPPTHSGRPRGHRLDVGRRGRSMECQQPSGAPRWRQQPQLGGHASRPEDEVSRPAAAAGIAEFHRKVAPPETVRLLGQEHYGRAGLLLDRRSDRR